MTNYKDNRSSDVHARWRDAKKEDSWRKEKKKKSLKIFNCIAIHPFIFSCMIMKPGFIYRSNIIALRHHSECVVQLSVIILMVSNLILNSTLTKLKLLPNWPR